MAFYAIVNEPGLTGDVCLGGRLTTVLEADRTELRQLLCWRQLLTQNLTEPGLIWTTSDEAWRRMEEDRWGMEGEMPS
jgi:hypothetical protein